MIEPATPADVPAIAALLRAGELPHDDFAPHVANFLVARNGGQIVGAVGAELGGADALLRSLVVAPAQRGTGLGGRLVDKLERAAGAWGVRRWWLLTTTAEKFFAARGFRVAARSEAPPAMQRTGQFSGGCGASAVCMTRERKGTTVVCRAGSPDPAAVEPSGTERRGRETPPYSNPPTPTDAGFDTAVAEFSAKLRAFIRRRVRDDATADDLTQETLLKVFRSREALRDGQRLEAWLYRIARTTLSDFYRRQRPGAELSGNLTDESAEPADEVTAAMARSLRNFLEELPEAYREPVRLAEFEGLPLAKIALRMGLSLTAVKSRVRRGRAMLKKKLQDCCRLEFDRMGKIIGYERRSTSRCCR